MSLSVKFQNKLPFTRNRLHVILILRDKTTVCRYNRISVVSFFQSVQRNKPVNPSQRLNTLYYDHLRVSFSDP